MKNFKKVVFGILAMLVMVTNVGALTKEDNAIDTNAAFDNCINSTEDTVKCTVIKDLSISAAHTIAGKDVTLTIANGVTVTLSSDLDVNTKLTINGGKIVFTGTSKIDLAAKSSLTVNGVEIVSNVTGDGLFAIAGGTTTLPVASDSDYTHLTVDSASKITSNYVGLYVHSGLSKISLNGEWVTSNDAIYVAAGSPEITINGGNYSANNIALNLAGTPTVVINDGTFKAATTSVFNLTGGTVDINSAVIDATNKTNDSTVKGIVNNGATLTIKKATVTTNDAYALQFMSGKTIIEDGEYTSDVTKSSAVAGSGALISGGEYTGSTPYTINNVKGNLAVGYSAAQYDDTVYVGKNHKLDIEVDAENGEIVELHTPQTLLSGHTYTFAYLAEQKYLDVKAAEGYVAKYVLVVGDEETVVDGDSFVMPDADAKLLVSFVKAGEEQPAPGVEGNDPTNDGEPAGDETEGKVPSTFDGIASIVTMAISSVSAAGYSIKKIIRK